jgi:quinol monooxygenase YgiN
MTEPIVFISRFQILDGKRDKFETAFNHLVDLIESTKPRTALYAAFVNEIGTEVRIIHAFPDAAAMTSHFEGSDERTESVSDLIVLAGFDVYGAAPVAAIEQLRREAAASSVELDLYPEPLGGFIRAAS